MNLGRPTARRGQRARSIAAAAGVLLPALLLDGTGGVAAATPEATAAIVRQVDGLDFSPYVDGQDPAARPTISEAQISARLDLVAPYTKWVRSFGCRRGLDAIGRLGRARGLHVAMGAWVSRDAADTAAEIDCLIAAVNRGEAEVAIVGSEALLRNDIDAGALIAAIQRVRSETTGHLVPVATADIAAVLLDHPDVIAAGDVVLGNFYPFWEGVPVDQAVGVLHQQYWELARAAGGRPTWVSETGWPSAGQTVGGAVPSPDNAAAYFLQVQSWARATGAMTFYFAALDEAWKVREEGPAGAHWGIAGTGGALKPGMQPVFDGVTATDTWSALAAIGGPGTPEVHFTSVPSVRGNSDDVIGRIVHAAPGQSRVLGFVNVGGRWYTKPYASRPATVVRPDGTWTFDYNTGGLDVDASDIAVFLVPRTYAAPDVFGLVNLPADLLASAQARADALRATASLDRVAPRPTDTVTGTASAYDPFGDPVGFTWVWRINGVVRRTTGPAPVATDTFDPRAAGGMRPGDVVSVEAIPANGRSFPVSGGAQCHVVVPPPVRTDIAVFRPSSGAWYPRGRPGTLWGQSGDVPVPADYGGDGVADVAVFRSSIGGWYVQGQSGAVWGQSGDVPVPADYDGDRRADVAVFRPSTGAWYVRGQAGALWGQSGDVPVPADYDGDGVAEIAVFRPSTGAWFVRGQTGVVWGQSGDVPVVADYDGDGRADIAVFRPSAGAWFVRGQAGALWGTSGDRPQPGDYDADGRADFAVFRPSTGAWYVRGQEGALWGLADDVALPLPAAVRLSQP